MIDISKFTDTLSHKKERKSAEVPGRKTATLTDENLKRFEKLQKRFPGATDSKLLNVAVEVLYESLEDAAAKEGKKAAKKNSHKDEIPATAQVEETAVA